MTGQENAVAKPLNEMSSEEASQHLEALTDWELRVAILSNEMDDVGREVLMKAAFIASRRLVHRCKK